MAKNAPILVALLAALTGFAFAAVSTNDFAQHLDREVHGLHCSFLPGLEDVDVSGETGCHLTLMSPYSSVMREAVWGGIPISLPAMAVFAFLAALAVFLLAAQRQDDVRATGFHLAAWGVPALTSIGMGYVAFETLDAACKLCIGIYASSAVGTLAAIVSLIVAFRASKEEPLPVPRTPARGDDFGKADDTVPAGPVLVPRSEPRREPLGIGGLAAGFAVGLAFVLVPVATYAAVAPDFSSYAGTCGTLPDSSDPHRVLIPIGPQSHEIPVIEVLDPLCPSCRGFEARFDASSVPEQASRRVLLFPLDNTCNWMIDRAIHPGACAISEAVLCAGDEADLVIDWAFENQAAIVEAAREDPEAAARMARARFPALSDCIGSPTIQARLNQSLRWAVQNELPVLTPQIYVGTLRLCDADTDLGMDYALAHLVERYRQNPGAAQLIVSEPAEVSVETPRPPSVAPTDVAEDGPADDTVPSISDIVNLPIPDPIQVEPNDEPAPEADPPADPPVEEAPEDVPPPAETPSEGDVQ